MIYFISGHGDVTIDEFQEHYVPVILEALVDVDAEFVVGDYKGADNRAQAFLYNHTDKVTVFHMFESPRINVGNFKTNGGYQSDEERDAAMTANSDIDIAWVREGREDSGTAKNMARRNK
jgi:hypothetical protein